MSKTINLNHTVRIKLTAKGLDEYMTEYNWKDRQAIIDNGMWLSEQLWVILHIFNTFANGGSTTSFTEMIMDDNTLENVLVPGEDPEMEKLVVWALTQWLGKHYHDNMIRHIGAEPTRPDYITSGVDIIRVIEYKPAAEPGRYHVANAFGVSYPDPNKRTRSLRQVKNMLLRNIKSQPARYAKSGSKIASD